MKYAKFSDDFLSDFRLDDNGETLVLTDMRGCTRAVRLLPYEERPHGEWIKWNFKTFGAMGDWEYKCSNCEKVYGGEYNFCPNCGADMTKGNT